MNNIKQNGVMISQFDDHLVVNGVRVEIPRHLRGYANTLTMIDGELRINGAKFDVNTKTFIDDRSAWKRFSQWIKSWF